MAAPKLARTVYLEVDGVTRAFGPADEVPAAVAKRITNPKAWEIAPEDDGSDSGDSGAVEPPETGRGSGDAVWREFATSLGLTVADDAKKADVIPLVRAHQAQAAGTGDQTPETPAEDASDEDWRAYAATRGFEVDADATGADVREALADAE